MTDTLCFHKLQCNLALFNLWFCNTVILCYGHANKAYCCCCCCWFDSLGTGVKNTFNKTLKCFRKKLSVSYFLPTRMFMPFLFLLIQISCQLGFSILSSCFTSRMIFILILHLQKSFICSRRHHLFMHITRDHPRKMICTWKKLILKN